MTTLASFGQRLFGGAIVGLGLVCLWYLDFVGSLQPVPAWMPGYTPLSVLNGVLLLGAGVAIVADRKSSSAALAVAALFMSGILVLHIPSAFTQPQLLRSPLWIRTFESLAFIGGASCLAGLRRTPRHDAWVRWGRFAFGISIPVFGVLHLIYAEATATLVPPWYPWPVFWAYATGVAQIAGGLAIAVGILPRPAAILAGTMYGLWALTLHVPRVWCSSWGSCSLLDMPGGSQAMRAETTSLFIVVGMAGVAWLVAGSIASATPPSEA